jgi:tetratricopeptide (TPR) repeat protein
MHSRTGRSIAICILALTFGVHTGPSMQAAWAQAKAAAQPTLPPGSIRTVLKVSSENAGDSEVSLSELHKRRPELGSLAERLKGNPADVEAIATLAEAYLQERFYLSAHDLFQELRLRAPDNAGACVGLAMVWDACGDPALALEYATQGAALDPGSSVALETLGRIHLHRRETEAALASFLAALAISPEDPALLATTGYVYMLKAEWEEARRHLQRAVEIGGSVSETHNNLGVVLARLGDPQGALREFMAVGDPAAAHNNLGVAYLGFRDWKAAQEEFRLALAINPEYSRARLNLWEAESHLPVEAVSAIESPNRSRSVPEAQNDLGLIATRIDREDGALRNSIAEGSTKEASGHLEVPHIPGEERPEAPGEPEHQLPTASDPSEMRSRPREGGAHFSRPAYAIQFYAAKDETSTRVAAEEMANIAGVTPVVERADSGTEGTMYRARLPGFRTFGAAQETAERFLRAGLIKDYWIVYRAD